MTHRFTALRAKILTYLFMALTATLIYLAIAFWDAQVWWKFLGAGVFSFVLFIVAMLLWDEEETQEKNELKAQEIHTMKLAQSQALPAEDKKALPHVGDFKEYGDD